MVGTYGFTSPLFGTQTLPPDPNGFNVRYYLALYDNLGNIQGARSLFDEYISQFYEVNVATILEDHEGEILITGNFEGDLALDMDSISSMGFQNHGFLLKINPQSFLNSTTDIEYTDLITQSFSFYPNPVNKAREITLNHSLGHSAKLSLLDLGGSVINYWGNVGSTQTVSVEGLPAGVYILNLRNQQRNLYRKVIIH